MPAAPSVSIKAANAKARPDFCQLCQLRLQRSVTYLCVSFLICNPASLPCDLFCHAVLHRQYGAAGCAGGQIVAIPREGLERPTGLTDYFQIIAMLELPLFSLPVAHDSVKRLFGGRFPAQAQKRAGMLTGLRNLGKAWRAPQPSQRITHSWQAVKRQASWPDPGSE